jgi:hypothetical protein
MSMTTIDERGRLFGRINLLDAAAALFLFVLIPASFGAYLLFRQPQPTLNAVSPNSIAQGPNQHVVVQGVNLRPFMRIAFGTTQALTFAIDSTTSAHVDLPDLLPGTYDVILYDFRDEVARLPKAFTVTAPASVSFMTLEVAGSFKNLNRAAVDQIRAGAKFTTSGQTTEILRVGTPGSSTFRLNIGQATVTVPVAGQFELPAAIRVDCYSDVLSDGSVRCMVGGPQHPAPVAPDSLLTVPAPQGWAPFQISSIALPVSAPFVDVRATFTENPEIAAAVKTGDIDSDAVSFDNASRGRVIAVNHGAAGTFQARFRVPAVQTTTGWVFHNQPLKAGLPFRFETPAYVIQGMALAVAPAAGPSR